MFNNRTFLQWFFIFTQILTNWRHSYCTTKTIHFKAIESSSADNSPIVASTLPQFPLFEFTLHFFIKRKQYATDLCGRLKFENSLHKIGNFLCSGTSSISWNAFSSNLPILELFSIKTVGPCHHNLLDIKLEEDNPLVKQYTGLSPDRTCNHVKLEVSSWISWISD